MRHVNFILFVWFLILNLLSACSSTPNVTYDEHYDFTPPKTFTFTDEHPLKYSATATNVNPFLEGYLMDSTREQLEVMGYRFVEKPAKADFAIAFTFGARDKIEVNSYPGYAGYGAGPGRHPFWSGAAYYGGTSSRSYTEGQLSIDFFDESSKKPAWHGTDSRKLTSSDQKNLKAAANTQVAKILNEFPPGN